MNQRYSFFQLFHLVILSICCVICRIYNIDSLFFFCLCGQNQTSYSVYSISDRSPEHTYMYAYIVSSDTTDVIALCFFLFFFCVVCLAAPLWTYIAERLYPKTAIEVYTRAPCFRFQSARRLCSRTGEETKNTEKQKSCRLRQWVVCLFFSLFFAVLKTK